jgi:hypothetical protein
MLHFRSPPSTISQSFLETDPSQVPQRDPYEERYPFTEPSTSHSLKIHLSLRVPGKGAPSMFPNRVPIERAISSPGPPVHRFIYVCQSPPKQEASYKIGKNIRSPSTQPHADGRPTYSGVRTGSPRGSFTTLLSLLQCHAVLGTMPSALALVDQSPDSQCVVASPTGYNLHTCYHLPRDPG